MVLEVRLSNFFSIKEEVVLDLRAGNIKNQQAKNLKYNVFTHGSDSILKTIAIYGANASGKSSIIKAIRFCCSMIFQSHKHNEGTTFNFLPFKFDGYNHKPSCFYIHFAVNNVEYEYSMTLTRTEVLKEELYHYPKGRKAKVYSRDETIKGAKRDKYSFGAYIKRPMDVAENTSNKTLYISRASQMDRIIAKEIFTYFQNTFLLSYIDLDVSSVERLFKENKSLIIKAMQIADSDIIDIRMKREKVHVKAVSASFPENVATINDAIEEELRFTTYHKSAPSIAFDLNSEESDGTKKLFAVLLRILDVVKNNKILIIDEIDTSLHSQIIEFIIQLFNASGKAQLIYSTHNTNLLDLTKIRKDQIYFVNKLQDGSTELYSLFDYKDFREKMNLEKAYLQGRFDAIPFIDDSIATLKSLING